MTVSLAAFTDAQSCQWWRSPRALLLLFLLSLPAVTSRLYASDEVQYFAYLRSLWFDQDVSFENEYRHYYDAGVARSAGFHETFLERRTETGRRINFGTIGCAILWSPFYGSADLAVRLLNAAGHDIPRDGYSRPYIAAVAYASAFYGLLALLLATHIVAQIARSWPELAAERTPAALFVWLGTPLLFYMYVAPPMSHATSAFAVALFLTTWLHVRGEWSLGGFVRLGLAAALMTMVREQDAFFAIGPAADFMHTQLTRRDGFALRRLGHALAGVLVAAAGFLPQALAYLALNGRVGPSRLVARKMLWHSPHATQVLASPSHGFLIWTPLAAVAIAGLILLWRRLPPSERIVAATLLVMMTGQVYVGGSVDSWTVAGAFGQRRFVALTAILTVGVAAVLAVARHRGSLRLLTMVLLAVTCWWNIGLMAQFGAGMMNRQRLEPARIAYNTFVVVPRALPELAWRYVFDRASFYESARRLRGT